MPLQFAGITAEHLAVRRHAGIFDVSHMGQVLCRGPGAQAFLQRLLTGDVRRIPEGGSQYALMCRHDGGVLDDLITYRLAEGEYLTVTNAANHARDLAWMTDHAAGFDVDVVDVRERFAMLAVQGPRAREIVSGMADGALPPRRHVCQRTLSGVATLVCATGYTGEEGVELLLDPASAGQLWDALLAAGVTPCGLGARDTLRIEACFCLYGNELGEDRDPISAGLGWACAEQTGFIGAEAVAAVRARGPEQRLVAFTIDGPGIPRAGNAVAGGGVVTSGTFSPCLQRGVGLAYVPAGMSAPGTSLQIDVRGKSRAATVQPKPLYRKGA